MKKLIVLVCAVVFLFGVIGFAQAHSDWGKYKNKTVPAGTKGVPGKYIDTTIKCCDCHGRISSIPPLDCR